MIYFGQIRQTNKSLTYCIYRNDNITQIYFRLPSSSGGVSVIMGTITGLQMEFSWSIFLSKIHTYFIVNNAGKALFVWF